MAALVLDGIQVKRPRCEERQQQGYANATELADYLVAKGCRSVKAHHIVRKAVVEALPGQTAGKIWRWPTCRV